MADLKSSLAEATDKVAQTVLSGAEPPSGEKGAGTIDSPFDAGNAPENDSTQPATTQSNHATTEAVSPKTTQQGSGLPQSTPRAAQGITLPNSKPKTEAVPENKPPPAAGTSTGVAAEGGNFDASRKDAVKEAMRLRDMDRDVSPGTRDDGSHATTSGERGEGYKPPTGLGKLKGKIFGKS